MQTQDSRTPYEVHCPRCDVTFPVGTRHCLHCGGRLPRERGKLPETQMSFETGMGFEEGEDPPEDERPRRSPFSPVALVWVLLFVGGTLYRACTSG